MTRELVASRVFLFGRAGDGSQGPCMLGNATAGIGMRVSTPLSLYERPGLDYE